MRVRASAAIPLVFHPDNRVRKVTVRVRRLLNGLITGARFFLAHQRIFYFSSGKGFKPGPLASRLPFSEDLRAEWHQSCWIASSSCLHSPRTTGSLSTTRTPQQFLSLLRLRRSSPSFTEMTDPSLRRREFQVLSVALWKGVFGSMPQDRQPVTILLVGKNGMEKEAGLALARGIQSYERNQSIYTASSRTDAKRHRQYRFDR